MPNSLENLCRSFLSQTHSHRIIGISFQFHPPPCSFIHATQPEGALVLAFRRLMQVQRQLTMVPRPSLPVWAPNWPGTVPRRGFPRLWCSLGEVRTNEPRGSFPMASFRNRGPRTKNEIPSVTQDPASVQQMSDYWPEEQMQTGVSPSPLTARLHRPRGAPVRRGEERAPGTGPRWNP